MMNKISEEFSYEYWDAYFKGLEYTHERDFYFNHLYECNGVTIHFVLSKIIWDDEPPDWRLRITFKLYKTEGDLQKMLMSITKEEPFINLMILVADYPEPIEEIYTIFEIIKDPEKVPLLSGLPDTEKLMAYLLEQHHEE